ncbi:ABC transporter substrate-binding protein [Syntrophobacter fumaroxidans]|uniref:Periplasmic binding protein n=1 Tax=Syntrophobacter fumaroxidans (strain DSM 10017 / MPOB) TaxID=335543 RepID=A0LFJ1_SYNFM|nr:ABC transporter substrate-binding protein [Syntrophobacter fumaroxidans]ABK16193.1 periplasmic binding protein [Syntrophobacter fumaroxidans MPOB]
MAAILVWFQLVLFVAAGAAPALAHALTLKDAAGKDVEIALPVRRVVFLSLYDLIPVFGIWDRAAGINRWAFDSAVLKGFPELKACTSVGTGDSVNVETLLSLHPDLVITWSYKPEVTAFLVERGLKVISVWPESLRELYQVIDLYGRIFQKEDRAREVRSLMENSLAATASKVSKVAPEKRPKVLWVWTKPTTVSGGIGLQQDLIRLIGAVNPAEHIPSKQADVSLEWIVAWDPDVIFIWGSARYGPGDLASNRQWKSVKAVRNGRVYKAPALSTWSPAVSTLALWMAYKAHPGCFDSREALEAIREFHMKCFGVPLEGLALD